MASSCAPSSSGAPSSSRQSVATRLADRDREEVARRVTLQKQKSLELQQQLQQQRPVFRRTVSEKCPPPSSSSPALSTTTTTTTTNNNNNNNSNSMSRNTNSKDNDSSINGCNSDNNYHCGNQEPPPDSRTCRSSRVVHTGEASPSCSPSHTNMPPPHQPPPLQPDRRAPRQDKRLPQREKNQKKHVTQQRDRAERGKGRGKTRRGQQKGRGEGLAGLLRRKEEELRREGMGLVLHPHQSLRQQSLHHQFHSPLRSHSLNSHHPLDSLSSLTVDTHISGAATAYSGKYPYPHQQQHHHHHHHRPECPAKEDEEEYVLGTQLEQESEVLPLSLSLPLPVYSQQSGATHPFSHLTHSSSHLTAPSGLSTSTFTPSACTQTARRGCGEGALGMSPSSDLCSLISRNRKAKQDYFLLQKKPKTVNLDQKSTLAREVQALGAAAGGSNYSTVMSKNRKVKNKLLRSRDRSSHVGDDSRYVLPFILSRAEREKENERRQQKDRARGGQNLSSSSWHQFLHALRGGDEGSSSFSTVSASFPSGQSQSQQHPEGGEGKDYIDFTKSELETAYNFMMQVQQQERRHGRRRVADSVTGEGVRVSGFSEACRQVRTARKQEAGEEQARATMRALAGMLKRTGYSLQQWFRLSDTSQAEAGDGILTHLEFMAAMHSTCERLAMPPFAHSDLLVMIKYMDPNADGDLSIAEMQAGLDRVQRPAVSSSVIAQAGPVLLYLLQCMHDQQKRAQDLFRSFVTTSKNNASGSGTDQTNPASAKHRKARASSTMSLEQLCEGVDALGLLVRPSAALLAEYGSLQQRRQAEGQAALLASRMRAPRGGGNQQPLGSVSSSGSGTGGASANQQRSEMTTSASEKSRLIQYHLTHEEQHDVNNYRYFLKQQQASVSSSPLCSRRPAATIADRSSSSKKVENDEGSGEDQTRGRIQVLQQQDQQLKRALAATSQHMHLLTAALVEAQEARAVVVAAGGCGWTDNMQQHSPPPPMSISSSSSSSSSSSPRNKDSKVRLATTVPPAAPLFSPSPPRGRGGGSGSTFPRKHMISHTSLAEQDGRDRQQFSNQSSCDFSP